jgi:hypothetical protein
MVIEAFAQDLEGGVEAFVAGFHRREFFDERLHQEVLYEGFINQQHGSSRVERAHATCTINNAPACPEEMPREYNERRLGSTEKTRMIRRPGAARARAAHRFARPLFSAFVRTRSGIFNPSKHPEPRPLE